MVELSGLEVFSLAKEIETGLRGTYVKNVYSLGGSQVIRLGRPGGDDVCILASPKHGVWISKRVAERAETTAFTTRLRQELGRERFSSARQLNRDRIFDLAFGEGEGAKHLIVELMPPGNVVVTDSKNRVLAVQDEVRSPSRRIVRGGVYSVPVQRRKTPDAASEADVTEAISKEKTAGAAVGRSFSLPRKYVAVVLSRIGVEEGSPSAALTGKENEVAETLRSLAREAEESPRPCVCNTPMGKEVFVVAPPGLEVEAKCATVSEICDEYLMEAASSVAAPFETQAEIRSRELEATAAKLRTQLEGWLKEAANLRDLAGRARAADSVAEAMAVLDSAGFKGSRDALSAESASSKVFDRAKELEAKAKDAGRAADDLAKKAAKGRRPTVKRTKELRTAKKEWYERFRWFTTSAGKLALGGRDAQSNSVLVKRHLDGEDTVYHADLFGSPFFILKGGKSQTAEECAEVSQATVAFSSAWKTGLGAADAYWVNPDQVSTSAPSGEFLARGSFVIRGKKNFVPHNLVEVAVGVCSDGRLVAGPESAVKGTVAAYVVLRPQNEKSSETAKKVKRDLEALTGKTGEASFSLDDVLRALPAGGGKVLRKYTATSARQASRNA